MFNRLREDNFSTVSSVRGWRRLEVSFGLDEAIIDTENEHLINHSVLIEKKTNAPLAAIYPRKSDLWVAWLPNPVFNQAAWVETICLQIAEQDHERFPNFGNWRKSPVWMTNEENKIVKQIEALEVERRETELRFTQQMAYLEQCWVDATLEANQGIRKLITSQGAELVDQVADILHEIGFIVEKGDDTIEDNGTKYEDLRLTLADTPDWVAIVEVRGYSRSIGQTSDFQRLSRFARHFFNSTKRWPSRKIYVLNSEIEIPPQKRQIPLAPAKEEVEEFGKDDGLLIWTADLYRVSKLLNERTAITIRESIVTSTGRWSIPSLSEEG